MLTCRLFLVGMRRHLAQNTSYHTLPKKQYTPLVLFDEATLEGMFFHYLWSVIRFQSRKIDTSWEHLLGRS